MPDKYLPILPGWVAFDHKIPVCDSDPDDLSDQVTVCFNAAWLPYVLGCLGALSRAEIWDTDDFTTRNLAALRGEDLLAQFMMECEATTQTPQTLVSTSDDGCGFKVSYDSGQSWQQFDLSGCIADIVGTGIDTAIANGEIAQPGDIPTSSEPPSFGSCKTYHVTLSAASTWLLPVKLSPADTVNVTNARGAWSDMKLDGDFPYDWNCADGGVYQLGACLPAQVPKSSDPFQDAHHMELILQFADDHALPMRGLVTIPGGVDQIDAMFVPNYDRSPLGSGTVEFDVEVCTSGWTHIFDFTIGQHGFDIWGYGGPYVPTQGYEIAHNEYAGGDVAQIYKPITLVSGSKITLVEFYFTGDSTPPGGICIDVEAGSEPAWGSNIICDNPPQTSPHQMAPNFDGGGSYVVMAETVTNSGGGYLTRLVLHGMGTDPF